MAEFTLEDYEQLRRRHTKLVEQFHQIGEEFQTLGRTLNLSPEWALFNGEGYDAEYSLRQVRFFSPEKLLSPEKLTEMVKELHKLYDDLETAYNQLNQKYPNSLKEPPRRAKPPTRRL